MKHNNDVLTDINPMGKTARIDIRIDEDTKQQLQAIAARDNTSISKMILSFIKKETEQHKEIGQST